MANVLHRTTKHYKPSVNTPDYPESEWVINPVFIPDFDAVFKVPRKYIKINPDDSVEEMTAAEKSAVDNAPEELASLKARRMEEIDAKTTSIISRGFQYAGKTFSLSIPAQLKWKFLESGMDKNYIKNEDFPMRVPTIDDKDHYDIPSKADAAAMLATIVQTGLYVLGTGQPLKDAINSATTAEEVDAVVDTR